MPLGDVRDKLTVGIGFHKRSRTLFPRPTPGVCVALHHVSQDLQWGGLLCNPTLTRTSSRRYKQL